MTRIERLSIAVQLAERLHALSLKKAQLHFELVQGLRAQLFKEFSEAIHHDGLVSGNEQLIRDLCSRASEHDLGSWQTGRDLQKFFRELKPLSVSEHDATCPCEKCMGPL